MGTSLYRETLFNLFGTMKPCEVHLSFKQYGLGQAKYDKENHDDYIIDGGGGLETV